MHVPYFYTGGAVLTYSYFRSGLSFKAQFCTTVELRMSDCYAIAGKCIDQVIAKKGTPKSVVFNEKKSKQVIRHINS